MTPENLLTEWARLLVVSLADAGVRELVVSPGSRSTPLVAAALASRRFRMTSVIDERSAGFFALGQAKVTGRPSAVVCTSGSAAANYFPAVVEASTARVPLLVITADRPFELHDCGAPQTFDQTRLYGVHVRRFVDLGVPDGDTAALGGLRRRAVQAVAETLAPEPGPVHLNVRARKPLEPEAARSDAGRDLAARVDAALARPATRSARASGRAPAALVSEMARSLRSAQRGVVVCGPAEVRQDSSSSLVARVAVATGFPVYAETTSQLRFGDADLPADLVLDALDVLLRIPDFVATFAPDVVLQIGESPTSAAWDRLVAARPGLERHVVTPGGWPDPNGTARTLIAGDVDDTLGALLAELGSAAAPSTPWVRALARANRSTWQGVDAVLAGEEALTEGGALRAVLDALPRGALLGVGNSLPVRHADVFCPARRAGAGLFAQRGLSGIDGVVSGAAGAAAASGRPTVLVVGDVSAVHDLGGFAVARESPAPLVVVVLNNGGGRIFEQLPFAAAGLGPDAERFWTTPPAVEFEAIGTLYGVRFERVRAPAALCDAVAKGLERPGCTVIEAVTPPHGARDQYERVLTAVKAALAREAPSR